MGIVRGRSLLEAWRTVDDQQFRHRHATSQQVVKLRPAPFAIQLRNCHG
jgi:hypothetical protein